MNAPLTGIVRVPVTQEHIDAGKCNKVTKCAVALALKGKFETAKVGNHGISISIGRKKVKLQSDIWIVRWILDFDYEKTGVAPFTLVLDFDKGTAYMEGEPA